MRIKKHGFTLIELLAVIVILAAIALIATPIVLKVVDGVRVSAAKQGVQNYMKAFDDKIALEQINSSSVPVGRYVVNENGNLSIGDKEYILNMKGKLPNKGSVCVGKGGKISSYSMVIDGYMVNMINDQIQTSKGSNPISLPCMTKEEPLEILTNSDGIWTESKIITIKGGNEDGIVQYHIGNEITNDAIYPWKYDYENLLWTSTNHDNSSSSSLKLTFELKQAATFSFEYMTSSYSSNRLAVYDNSNNRIINIGGYSSTEFTTYSITLDPGVYTYTFKYNRSSNTNRGNDEVYVKNIKINDDTNLLNYYPNDKWTNYSEPFEMTSNDTVYARVQKDDEVIESTSLTITKIDATKPVMTLSGEVVSGNSVSIPFTAIDMESGIKNTTCEYGKTRELGSVAKIVDGKCVIEDVEANTAYYYKITSENNAGGIESITKIYAGTYIDYEPDGISQTKTIKVTGTTGDGTSLQYRINNGNWININSGDSFELKSNATIYARVYDGEIESNYSSLTITTIDNLAPNLYFESVNMESGEEIDSMYSMPTKISLIFSYADQYNSGAYSETSKIKVSCTDNVGTSGVITTNSSGNTVCTFSDPTSRDFKISLEDEAGNINEQAYSLDYGVFYQQPYSPDAFISFYSSIRMDSLCYTISSVYDGSYPFVDECVTPTSNGGGYETYHDFDLSSYSDPIVLTVTYNGYDNYSNYITYKFLYNSSSTSSTSIWDSVSVVNDQYMTSLTQPTLSEADVAKGCQVEYTYSYNYDESIPTNSILYESYLWKPWTNSITIKTQATESQPLYVYARKVCTFDGYTTFDDYKIWTLTSITPYTSESISVSIDDTRVVKDRYYSSSEFSILFNINDEAVDQYIKASNYNIVQSYQTLTNGLECYYGTSEDNLSNQGTIYYNKISDSYTCNGSESVDSDSVYYKIIIKNPYNNSENYLSGVVSLSNYETSSIQSCSSTGWDNEYYCKLSDGYIEKFNLLEDGDNPASQIYSLSSWEKQASPGEVAMILSIPLGSEKGMGYTAITYPWISKYDYNIMTSNANATPTNEYGYKTAQDIINRFYPGGYLPTYNQIVNAQNNGIYLGGWTSTIDNSSEYNVLDSSGIGRAVNEYVNIYPVYYFYKY